MLLALNVAFGIEQGAQLVGGDIAGESVAQHKIAVGFLAASHKEACAVGCLVGVGACLYAQRGAAGFNPDESPVIVEAIF